MENRERGAPTKERKLWTMLGAYTRRKKKKHGEVCLRKLISGPLRLNKPPGPAGLQIQARLENDITSLRTQNTHLQQNKACSSEIP